MNTRAFAALGVAAAVAPLLVTAVSRLNAQSQEPLKLEFEVATIRSSNPEHVGAQMFSPGPGRFTAMTATVKDLMGFAYNLRPHQIAGGPGWLDAEKYDITAKADGRVTNDQLKAMLQALFETRFQLKAHRETKEMPVYDLVIAKNGPKLHEVDKPGMLGLGATNLRGRGANTPMLADQISARVGRTVLDKTGLKGYYEFELKWAPLGATDSTDPDLFAAIQEQLGLKLEPSRGPVEVMVIDHAEKPTDN